MSFFLLRHEWTREKTSILGITIHLIMTNLLHGPVVKSTQVTGLTSRTSILQRVLTQILMFRYFALCILKVTQQVYCVSFLIVTSVSVVRISMCSVVRLTVAVALVVEPFTKIKQFHKVELLLDQSLLINALLFLRINLPLILVVRLT